MEAKDLMCYDCVRNTRTKEIERVFEVDDDREVINTEFDGYNGIRDIQVSYLEPIPITTEILAKNAKSVEKVGCCTYYEFNDNFAIKEFSGVFFFCELENGLLGKGEITDNTWMRMDYVHELQHALRLVGLSEVADNIKI